MLPFRHVIAIWGIIGMKSSTIRRSNLSKEKMAVLEALSKFNDANNINLNNSDINSEPIEDGSPEVYVRQNKEKELDLLWKDFKMPKGERSPIVYLGIGFISGIIATLLVGAIIVRGLDYYNHTVFEIEAEVEGFGSNNVDSAVVSDMDNKTEVSAPLDVNKTINTSSLTNTAVEANKEAATNSGKKFGFFGNTSSNNAKQTEETVAAQNKEYEVQEGDTIDKIVRTFYGSYSTENVDAILKANNMSNPNKLSIGQKLIIPVKSSAE